MSPLERVGWVSGIIVALLSMLSFVVGDLPILWRYALGIVATIILLMTAVWSRIRKLKGYTAQFRLTKWISSKLRRKPKSIKVYDLNSFDKHFETLKQASEPKTKAKMLQEFRNRLYELTYGSYSHITWDDDIRSSIIKVLNLVSKDFNDTQYTGIYLDYLHLILYKQDRQITNVVKEMFLDRLETLYGDPKFETNSIILFLLLRLNEYRKEYMMKLVDEAIHRWSKQRFDALSSGLELYELKKIDGAHDGIRKYLVRKMDEAERSQDEEAHARAEKLLDMMRN